MTERKRLVILGLVAWPICIGALASGLSIQPAEGPGYKTGVPEEMRALSWMVGVWDVTSKMVGPNGSPVATPALTVHITSELDGCMLREAIEIPAGNLVMKTVGYRSYDQFRRIYRVIWFDNFVALADIYEGTLKEDGSFVTTNLKSGTTLPGGAGELVHVRKTLTRRGQDTFLVKYEMSSDNGKTWASSGVSTYVRKPEP